ncbi:MAG: sigma-70 family RNA polymerase sigma factor [Vicinamibacteria bacterium]
MSDTRGWAADAEDAALRQIVASLGRIRTAEPEFREEAESWLLARGPELRARFRGRSSFATYLQVVVRRFYVDWRRKRHGYWRPSAAARRAGPAAVRYETLTRRDRRPHDEALEALRSEGLALTEEEAADLEQRLPNRAPRSFEPEQALQALAATGPAPDEEAALREARVAAPALEAAIRRATDDLGDEEKLMLRLRYLDGLTVREVGTMLGVSEKPLYKRYERLLLRLRASLISQGATPGQVLFALGKEGWNFEGALLPLRQAPPPNRLPMSVSRMGDQAR